MAFDAFNLTGSSVDVERQGQDFYPTPTWATLEILKREKLDGEVWEPACGDGAISRLLNAKIVHSSDLYDRGFGEVGVDFLTSFREVDDIITNPPFKLAQQFVEHGLLCARNRVIMLLKLAFLETQGRKEFFQRTPLRSVYVFSKRVSFFAGTTAGDKGGLLAYAWFVWERGYDGKPMIEWI